MKAIGSTARVIAGVAGAWMALGGVAGATMPMQKKAKELGFPAASCQYCHTEKLPKKESHESNDRGKFLEAEKERLKAKEIDVSWLKNYVEKK